MLETQFNFANPSCFRTSNGLLSPSHVVRPGANRRRDAPAPETTMDIQASQVAQDSILSSTKCSRDEEGDKSGLFEVPR